MKNSNASLFRRYALVEEDMLRASMPRISAQDLTPLNDRRMRDVVASFGTSRLVRVVRPLTYTIAEVANA